jgi:hypothetical protein
MGTPVFFPAFVPALFLVIGLVALQGAVLHAGAADMLTIDRPLSGTQRSLVSKRGQFALGFFQPGTYKPRQIYACTPLFFVSLICPPCNLTSCMHVKIA